uniref:Uncharacterized protein LOC108038931 n=1 Tax=Drosophila rhopaloa TaxID=1041015 RepID=A0A6P4E7W1_DRORH
MWDYRQEIDLETSVKISPYCHAWQSACWFMLKGLDLWRFLVWDRSASYLVVLTICLIGLSWMLFKSFRRRWNEVPISEIQLLRDRVQFVSQDMVMLQDALNATLVSKPVASISSEVIDAMLEKKAAEDGENSPSDLNSPVALDPQDPPDSDTIPESAAKNPDPKLQENALNENNAPVDEKVPEKQTQTENKPLLKTKPRRVKSPNPRDLKENPDVDNRNMRRRQPTPESNPGWKL